EIGLSVEAVRRCRDDDRPAARVLHRPRGQLDGEEHACQIDRQRIAPKRVGCFRKWRGFADSRIRDYNVERTTSLDCLFYGCTIGYVALDEFGGRRQFLRRLAVENKYFRSGAG